MPEQHNHRTRRSVLAIPALAGAAILVAACGSGDGDGCEVESDGDIECGGVEVYDPDDHRKKKPTDKNKKRRKTAPRGRPLP